MARKKRCESQDKVRVPLLWRFISILAMFPLAYGIFILIFRKSGGRLPLQAGDSTDPIFFAFIFGLLIPALLYLFIIEKVMRGIVARRSKKDIAADVAKDIGIATAQMAAEVILGGGSSSDRSSSSGSGRSGGGGEFGGGGASGGY